ncbi:hypothetical protein [Nocardia sp. NPDC127526]|uniref:hypothetical protein n=1 Tax=Nocardia sp. NPDC127526 TaxID=3345393 RepID=UPI00362AF1BF
MRRGRPSEEQLRRNFDSALDQAVQGSGVRTESGLDEQTEKALWAIARANGAATAEMVEAARLAFAGQLDGSNAAARKTAMARNLAERAARRRRPEN